MSEFYAVVSMNLDEPYGEPAVYLFSSEAKALDAVHAAENRIRGTDHEHTMGWHIVLAEVDDANDTLNT